jgi:Transposase
MLKQWCTSLPRSKVAPIKDVGWMIRKHFDGIVAWTQTRQTNGFIEAIDGLLTLHFFPGYVLELNPDELAWSHVKRTGASRSPLRRAETLRDKIEAQLRAIKQIPQLIRLLYLGPNVAYNTDLWVTQGEPNN